MEIGYPLKTPLASVEASTFAAGSSGKNIQGPDGSVVSAKPPSKIWSIDGAVWYAKHGRRGLRNLPEEQDVSTWEKIGY